MSSNEYLSSKNRLFEHLDDILCLPEISTDTVKFFKWEFKFLDLYLTLHSFIDEPEMLDVTQKVQALFEDALVDFSELDLVKYLDFYTSKVQNKICTFKTEIKAKYSFPKISLPLSANKDGIDIRNFVTGFINIALENLHDLVKIDVPCSLLNVPETMEHIEDVSKELKLLQNFASFVTERFIEPQSQHVDFFTHVLAVASYATMLSWLYFPGRGSKNQDFAPEEISLLLSDFLRMRIMPIQPSIRKIYIDVLQALKSTIQSGWYPNIRNENAIDCAAGFTKTILHNLVDLPTNSNSSQIVPLKDHLEILEEMLKLLRANIIHVPVQDFEPLLRDVDTVIIDVGLLVYSLYEGEVEKEGMELGKVNPAPVCDLSGNIQHINTVIYFTIRKAFQSKLPRIHGLGYVDFLLNNLKEFQRRYVDSSASVMNQLQVIQKELVSLQPFLKAVAVERHNDPDKIQTCATQLIGKAYEVEYIVDVCIRKEAHVWCLERWLLDIMKEIAFIRTVVAEIQEKKMVGDAMTTVTTHTLSDLERSSVMNEEFVGFEDVIEKLRGQLIKGTKGRDVISIIGMPGLGKTTLACRLYSDRLVVSHFDIRAQYCVSQVYSRKDMLLAILCDALGENSKNRENRADDELADELRKSLFSKRYLILVDDLWETSAWDDLRGCFQDANNGSRIILTTRNHEVANYARFQSDPLSLRMFNDDESWELLQKKVFGEESCSPLLTNIGQQIAKMCGQLPLSVTLVAGILAKMERKEECWEQVAKNLGPHVHSDSRVIIGQSYQNLPYHLRSCFLYFGAFVEDIVVNVSDLTRLWISEGFIQSCEGKSLEDTAEGYLGNLIGRNLVMGAKRSSGGKIKACRIHDLLHDFCKERAKEENLFRWIIRDQIDKPAHRMSIYCEKGYHIELSSSWSLASSVILHNTGLSSFSRDNNGLSADQVSYIFHNFKFLKVLDLNSVFIKSFPTELVYLRYFAAQTHVESVPSSLANLWNLQTLKLTKWPGKMTLPITLWEIAKFRHLHIFEGGFAIENAEELRVNSIKHYDLKTLSVAYFPCVEDAELILGTTPNLRYLRCEVKGVDNFEYCILKFPSQLETLKIRVTFEYDLEVLPFCISAPNLRNLRLSWVHLVPCHLSNIGLLQNLQVLKLDGAELENGEWEVSSDEFPQLKVLKLIKLLNFKEWTVADDAFLNLECLFLRECKNLKEIPSSFGDISSLKSIEVWECNECVAKSALDIQETQVEDYENSGFKVVIREKVVSDSGDDDDDDNDDDDSDW